MIRYHCWSDLLPTIEAALAMHGYHIEMPLQKRGNDAGTMVMTYGLTSVLLAQWPDKPTLSVRSRRDGVEVRSDSAAYRTVHELWNGVDSGSAIDRSGPRPRFSSRLSCAICSLSAPASSPMRLLSISDLKTELDALIGCARASGLAVETIVRALRDELEFAAEMGRLGHRFVVQLIDLGPPGGLILHRPVRDRREILQTHSVNESAPG